MVNPDRAPESQASNHFPPHVRDALIRASRVPEGPGQQFARQNAIKRVIEKARADYPELFKQEPPP